MKKHTPAATLPKLELVEWVDSTSPNSGVWLHNSEIEEISEPSVCYTVGFVLKETPTSLTLVGSYSDTQSSGSMCIPKVALLRRSKVRI